MNEISPSKREKLSVGSGQSLFFSFCLSEQNKELCCAVGHIWEHFCEKLNFGGSQFVRVCQDDVCQSFSSLAVLSHLSLCHGELTLLVFALKPLKYFMPLYFSVFWDNSFFILSVSNAVLCK